MKKHIRTKAVSSIILDSAKSKLNLAIKFVESSATDFVVAWNILQNAKNDLYLLETIFYCERENAIVDRIKNISIKLAKSAIALSDISPVAKECYQAIKDLECDITKELDKSEFSPANVEKLLMAEMEAKGV